MLQAAAGVRGTNDRSGMYVMTSTAVVKPLKPDVMVRTLGVGAGRVRGPVRVGRAVETTTEACVVVVVSVDEGSVVVDENVGAAAEAGANEVATEFAVATESAVWVGAEAMMGSGRASEAAKVKFKTQRATVLGCCMLVMLQE